MSKRDYKVGYKKPPVHAQFQKGRCPYRGGRKKKLTVLEELEKVLAEMIGVSEGGRRVMMSKDKALIRRVVADALAGDKKMIQTVLNCLFERDKAFSQVQVIPDEYLVAMALMNMSWRDREL